MSRTVAQPFQVWIRREAAAGASFGLRYAVQEGRGLLRVAHGAGFVDSPARATGEVGGLTAAQIASSRFVYVAVGAHRRDVHAIAGPSASVADALPVGEWVALVVSGASLAVPPQSVFVEDTDDAPTSPGALRPASTRVEGPQAPPPPAPPTDDHTEEVDFEDLSLDPGEATLARLGALPSEPPGADALHARPTTLVRHLRRRIAADRARIEELERRVAELEARLRLGT